MLNLILAHAALGGVLGLGSRVGVLLLPSLAAFLEAALIVHVAECPIVFGPLIVMALLTSLQAGYLAGSLAVASRLESYFP